MQELLQLLQELSENVFSALTAQRELLFQNGKNTPLFKPYGIRTLLKYCQYHRIIVKVIIIL